ncbi:MAG: type II secretion system F family protein [Planctomycetales bacterium]|nr:type II secretion system F family protein [Planctomycetales bacterium]
MTVTNSRTIKLDNESLVMLLDEVAAMVASGQSFADGLQALGDDSMGRLGQAANAVRADIRQGKSASESIAALSTTYRAPITAAIDVMACSGSTEPIHEAVRLIREDNDAKHQLILASINPILNVVVSAAILFFVMPWIVVSLSEAELIKSAFSPSIREITQSFAQNFALATFAAVSIVATFSLILYWGISRTSRTASGYRNRATLCRWLAMQLKSPNAAGSANAAGRDLGTVIETAAKVVGPQCLDSWAEAITNIRGGMRAVDSLGIPDSASGPVRQCVADLVMSRRDGDSVAFDLRRLADLYSQKSCQLRKRWLQSLPKWVSWLLMIIMIAILMRAITVPIIDVVGGMLR